MKTRPNDRRAGKAPSVTKETQIVDAVESAAAVKAAEAILPRRTGRAADREVRGTTRAAVHKPSVLSVMQVPAQGRALHFNEGLYVVHLGAIASPSDPGGSVMVPATQLVASPSGAGQRIKIAASSGDFDGWYGAEGGTVVLQVPPGGGAVIVTTYGAQAGEVALDIRRLDRSSDDAAVEPSAPAQIASSGQELRTEILLHLERSGDRRSVGEGWVGNRGQKLRVEAFGIRLLETLSPADVEYKAFGPNGLETSWASEGKLCGTRGRGLPLTGFAIRLSAPALDRFDVIYQGSFFSSGVIGPVRNGAPCRPVVADDPLEAINVRVIERTAAYGAFRE
jgi:hypothetical protein